MQKFWRDWWADESGSIAVIAALGMMVFAGFTALAVDVGRVVSVKAELQKAADAGALAGARALSESTPPPYAATSKNAVVTTLYWTNGSNVALGTVQLNSADNHILTNATVQTGYWNRTWSYPGPANLQANTFTPTSIDWWPAVKVTISKSSGVNDGAVDMLFGPLLGKATQDVTVQAVAGLAPETGGLPGPGPGFPQAVPEDLVELYFDQDPPVTFRIGSAYHSPDPDHGQWTTFQAEENNVPYVRDLIANGNPTSLNIGDNIWIQPGTKTSLYSDAATRIGEIVMLPVVGRDVDLTNKQFTPLLGFVPFKITDAVGGSGKYIEGHFVNEPVVIPGGTPKGGGTGGAIIYSQMPKLLS